MRRKQRERRKPKGGRGKQLAGGISENSKRDQDPAKITPVPGNKPARTLQDHRKTQKKARAPTRKSKKHSKTNES